MRAKSWKLTATDGRSRAAWHFSLSSFIFHFSIFKERRRMLDTADAFASGDGRTARWCAVTRDHRIDCGAGLLMSVREKCDEKGVRGIGLLF
jgi:hypothetical protein